jgi:[histone H3]-lysine9 N-trimethyltransferase EHMT
VYGRAVMYLQAVSYVSIHTGEVLEDEEATQAWNDEYLFDIGRKYRDENLCWERQFTIDGARCGNVGRFINHSCSPNLYAQNVLWDHDDMRMPHVMFFAAENIPPLQELTCDYNYKIGSVRDDNGVEKVKHCYCGSSVCRGRLY